VYTSCSERGLKRLLLLWPYILEKYPEATLKISSYNIFPKDKDEEYIKILIQKYSSSVTHLGVLGPSQLYELMLSSEYWLYPSYWPETSCITAMEMLSCGVICLFYPVAGLPETINNIGFPIEEGKELEVLFNLNDQVKENTIKKGLDYVQKCLWQDRFPSWDRLLELTIKKRVISYSLWGDDIVNNYGAIKNALLFKRYFPDFECWFYVHEPTVSQKTITVLKSLKDVKIILKTGDVNVMWRYECIDDPEVELFLSRETHSRFSEREKVAVQEWLDSEKVFHIMRDHPDHTSPIISGIFGSRKIPGLPNWKKEMEQWNQNDEDFLTQKVYPLIKNNALIHANFNKLEKNTKNFKTAYNENFNYVGQIFNENEYPIKNDGEKIKDYFMMIP
jgi:hypothetical protein